MAILKKTSLKEQHQNQKKSDQGQLEQVKSSKTKSSKKRSMHDRILQDLENMYQAAFEANNFAVALRVLELRGKQLGLFTDKKPEPVKSLKQMSKQELQVLLDTSAFE